MYNFKIGFVYLPKNLSVFSCIPVNTENLKYLESRRKDVNKLNKSKNKQIKLKDISGLRLSKRKEK